MQHCNSTRVKISVQISLHDCERLETYKSAKAVGMVESAAAYMTDLFIVHRGFWPLCHLNWAKVRTKATASDFASYNLCEDADISALKYTLAYNWRLRSRARWAYSFVPRISRLATVNPTRGCAVPGVARSAVHVFTSNNFVGYQVVMTSTSWSVAVYGTLQNTRNDDFTSVQ